MTTMYAYINNRYVPRPRIELEETEPTSEFHHACSVPDRSANRFKPFPPSSRLPRNPFPDHQSNIHTLIFKNVIRESAREISEVSWIVSEE